MGKVLEFACGGGRDCFLFLNGLLIPISIREAMSNGTLYLNYHGGEDSMRWMKQLGRVDDGKLGKVLTLVVWLVIRVRVESDVRYVFF